MNSEKVSDLEKQHLILLDSYNKLCDDLQNGEHVEMSWVVDAIHEAANCMMANVYQSEIKRFKEKLAKANDLIDEMKKCVEFYAKPNGSKTSGLITHTMYLNDIDTHESIGYILKLKGKKARQLQQSKIWTEYFKGEE